ncbi:MAG: hypothetical protein ACYCVD_08560 [Desulfitobacteriaceae bacterium]
MDQDIFEIIQNLIRDREWGLEFVEEAIKDLKYYQTSGRLEVIIGAIIEGHKNPLPKADGGTGDLLGKDRETGDGRSALYWKLSSSVGIRIVYGLEPPIVHNDIVLKKKTVLILVIGPRRKKEAYHIATKRLPKYRSRI